MEFRLSPPTPVVAERVFGRTGHLPEAAVNEPVFATVVAASRIQASVQGAPVAPPYASNGLHCASELPSLGLVGTESSQAQASYVAGCIASVLLAARGLKNHTNLQHAQAGQQCILRSSRGCHASHQQNAPSVTPVRWA